MSSFQALEGRAGQDQPAPRPERGYRKGLRGGRVWVRHWDGACIGAGSDSFVARREVNPVGQAHLSGVGRNQTGGQRIVVHLNFWAPLGHAALPPCTGQGEGAGAGFPVLLSISAWRTAYQLIPGIPSHCMHAYLNPNLSVSCNVSGVCNTTLEFRAWRDGRVVANHFHAHVPYSSLRFIFLGKNLW